MCGKRMSGEGGLPITVLTGTVRYQPSTPQALRHRVPTAFTMSSSVTWRYISVIAREL